jgi:tight adherence protein B
MTPQLQGVLFAFSAMLVAGGSAGLVVDIRERRRRREMKARMEAVSGTARQARPAAVPAAITRRRQVERPGSVVRLAKLFGYESAQADQYPAPWFVVLPVTGAIGYIAALFATGLFGIMSYALMPVAWMMLSRTFFGWSVGKRKALLLQQLPDALALIVRAVRVGIPVGQAFHAVAREMPEPTAAEFLHLVSQTQIGVPVEGALQELAERNDLAEYRFFATALSLQAQTGGALSETLDNLAELMRKRAALKSRGKALTSEARSSGAILAVLPLLSGAMLYVSNPDYVGMLFTDPSGLRLLKIAILSLCIGVLTMRGIINGALNG